MLVELGEQGTATKKEQGEMLQAFQRQVAQWRDRESMYLQPLYLEAASSLDDITRAAAESVGDKPPPEDTTTTWGTPQELVGDDELADEPEDNSGVGEKRKRGNASVPPAPTVGDKKHSEEWNEVNNVRIDLPSGQHAAIHSHSALKIASTVERVIRREQAKTHLDNLRAQLITTFGVNQVRLAVHGQGLTTRAQAAVKRKWKTVHSAADAYRRAWRALVALGMSETDPEFRVLKKGDVKAFKMYNADEELAAARQELGQSRKAPSWLWERWDFINYSADPKFRAYFEEGAYNLITFSQTNLSPASIPSSLVPLQRKQSAMGRRGSSSRGRNETMCKVFYVLPEMVGKESDG